ncbi:DDE-type integrase/transposase/recombinase [Halomonas sp. BN3-1]|uniref:DDE-type integrase/transposase/recombinase n=1 Tax=Halomonas sp. BN3-1 TaxID=2082393 RepID=UPI000D339CAC|nr:DDE-type integrase/transposase/recombinase [Halomonas sp. BN3-1]
MKYAFIQQHHKVHRIRRMCAFLCVARGYYVWRKRVDEASPRRRQQAETDQRAAECHQYRSDSTGEAGRGTVPYQFFRRLACVLGEKRKPIQRIKGWQVRKRPQRFRHRAMSLPFVASRPDECWATDLVCVWCGKDRRASLAILIDCGTREILGWRLTGNGSNKTVEAALEEALIYLLGALGRVQPSWAFRSDNGLIFRSRQYTGPVKAYGMTQEFATPHILRNRAGSRSASFGP